MTSKSMVITMIDKSGWARIESSASVPLSIATRMPRRANGVSGEDHQSNDGLDRCNRPQAVRAGRRRSPAYVVS